MGGLAAALTRASLKPNFVLITGLERDGRLVRALEARFGGRVAMDSTQVCERRVASLCGGIDGYFARRSPKFRAELRRAERRLLSQGGAAEYLTDGNAQDIMQRIISVEQKSWKGQSAQGVDVGLLKEFYQEIIETLLDQGAFRGVFIRHNGIDIGFAFGGIEGSFPRSST